MYILSFLYILLIKANQCYIFSTLLGAGLIYFSNVVKEVSYDYTDCVSNGQLAGQTCADILENNPSPGT